MRYAKQPEFATAASAITKSDTFGTSQFLDGASLFVGVGGDVAVVMNGVATGANLAATDVDVIFKNVPSGTFLPISVDYLVSTGTTASDILKIT